MLQAAAVARGNGTRNTSVSINYSIKERSFKNISLYTLYHINYACLFCNVPLYSTREAPSASV